MLYHSLVCSSSMLWVVTRTQSLTFLILISCYFLLPSSAEYHVLDDQLKQVDLVPRQVTVNPRAALFQGIIQRHTRADGRLIAGRAGEDDKPADGGGSKDPVTGGPKGSDDGKAVPPPPPAPTNPADSAPPKTGPANDNKTNSADDNKTNSPNDNKTNPPSNDSKTTPAPSDNKSDPPSSGSKTNPPSNDSKTNQPSNSPPSAGGSKQTSEPSPSHTPVPGPSPTPPPDDPQGSPNTAPFTTNSLVTGANGETSTIVITVTPSPSPSVNSEESNAKESKPLAKSTVVGLSVAGSIAAMGVIGFIAWKFTRKRASDDYDDNEDIKWPDLNSHQENVHALPTSRTGGSGFDTNSKVTLTRNGSYTGSMATSTSENLLDVGPDPYAVPPFPHLSPNVANQPYRDDPAVSFQDSYDGPVSDSIPMTQIGRSPSPGPRMAFDPATSRARSPGPQAGYDMIARRPSPGPHAALAPMDSRARSPGPGVAYGGRSASPGPQASYGRSPSPGPQAAYGRSPSPGPQMAYGYGPSDGIPSGRSSPGPRQAFGV